MSEDKRRFAAVKKIRRENRVEAWQKMAPWKRAAITVLAIVLGLLGSAIITNYRTMKIKMRSHGNHSSRQRECALCYPRGYQK